MMGNPFGAAGEWPDVAFATQRAHRHRGILIRLLVRKLCHAIRSAVAVSPAHQVLGIDDRRKLGHTL